MDEGGFGATLITDAAVAITQQIGIPMDVTVISVLDVKEVLGVGKALDGLNEETIASSLKVSICNKEGIRKLFVLDDQTKNSIQVKVEHNPYYVTASQIVRSLDSNLKGYSFSIKSDGGADGCWALSTMKKDEQDVIEFQKSSLKFPVILSGILCAISLLR